MKAKKQQFWFWAEIVLGTVRKTDLRNPKSRCEVWQNLVIIKAKTPAEALRKAETIGKHSSGDSRGTLRFFGKPAIQMFLGVSNLGVIHEKLEDGAEIYFSLRRLPFQRAKALVTPRRKLIREVTKAFGYVRSYGLLPPTL
jgi:hypothetical protein